MKPGRGDPRGLVELPAGPGTVGKDCDLSSDIASSTASSSSSSLSSGKLERIVEQLRKVKMACDQPVRAVVPVSEEKPPTPSSDKVDSEKVNNVLAKLKHIAGVPKTSEPVTKHEPQNPSHTNVSVTSDAPQKPSVIGDPTNQHVIPDFVT